MLSYCLTCKKEKKSKNIDPVVSKTRTMVEQCYYVLYVVVKNQELLKNKNQKDSYVV